VKLAIQAGQDVNYVDSDGETPLLSATKNCHEKVVKFLFEQGADVNFVSPRTQMTPLRYARGCDPGLAEWLLEQGAKLDLLSAVLMGRVNDIRRLLEDFESTVTPEKKAEALARAVKSPALEG